MPVFVLLGAAIPWVEWRELGWAAVLTATPFSEWLAARQEPATREGLAADS